MGKRKELKRLEKQLNVVEEHTKACMKMLSYFKRKALDLRMKIKEEVDRTGGG